MNTRPTPTRTRAFSLVELSVLVAVTGVTASLGLVTFASSLARYRADKAAHRLAQDITAAQRTAERTSTPAGLLFATAKPTYAPTGSWTRLTDGSPAVDLAASPYYATLDTLTFAAGIIAFDAHANALTSGSIALANGAQQRLITLDAATGAITIESINEPDPDPDPDPDPSPAPVGTPDAAADADAESATRTVVDTDARDITSRAVAELRTPPDELITPR